MYRSLLKRGLSKDFDASNLICGQAAFILDTKELCFCFSAGTCERLKLSEEISKERAEELINLITEFMESNPRSL